MLCHVLYMCVCVLNVQMNDWRGHHTNKQTIKLAFHFLRLHPTGKAAAGLLDEGLLWCRPDAAALGVQDDRLGQTLDLFGIGGDGLDGEFDFVLTSTAIAIPGEPPVQRMNLVAKL